MKHVAEPCYAAFAVLEVASSLLSQEMGNIVEGMRQLVGEVDFSFHVMGSETTLADTDSGKGKLA